MAEVLLFHHAQGQTEGFHAFADELRRAGHTVHTPDLFDGKTFGSIDEGLAHVQEDGFGDVHRAWRASCGRAARRAGLRRLLARRAAGAEARADAPRRARRAPLLLRRPASEFGEWPEGVPAQIHGMDADPFFVDEGDIDAARELVDANEDVELFLYPGDQHYFADSSLPSYDEKATKLLTERVLAFLEAVAEAPSQGGARGGALLGGGRPRRAAARAHGVSSTASPAPGALARGARVPDRLSALLSPDPAAHHGQSEAGFRSSRRRETGVNFVTPGALDAARARTSFVERHQSVDHQRLWADLLSPAALAFNLFGELAADLERADRALHAWWPDVPGTVSEVRFTHSPGRLDPAWLGNLVDLPAAFVLDLGDGAHGILGVVVGYHDVNRRQPPKPSRLPRYREIAERSGAFAPGWLDAVNGTELIHIWLDHCSCSRCSSIRTASWRWGRLVVVHPAGNTDYAEACDRYRSLLADDSTFASSTLEGLLDAGALSGRDDPRAARALPARAPRAPRSRSAARAGASSAGDLDEARRLEDARAADVDLVPGDLLAGLGDDGYASSARAPRRLAWSTAASASA